MFLKSLSVGCIFLVFAARATSSDALPSGAMEGHLKIVSPRAVEPSDNMPRPAVAPETYAEYPLIILSQDEKKEIAHVTADENGKYRIALPAGAYFLAVQDRTTKRVRGKREPFTIVSNQTVRVDMNVFAGFR